MPSSKRPKPATDAADGGDPGRCCARKQHVEMSTGDETPKEEHSSTGRFYTVGVARPSVDARESADDVALVDQTQHRPRGGCEEYRRPVSAGIDRHAEELVEGARPLDIYETPRRTGGRVGL